MAMIDSKCDKATARAILEKAGVLFNKRDGYMMNSRVRRLSLFIKEHCKSENEALERVSIRTNTKDQCKPKPHPGQCYERIGCVKGKYQLWAVIKDV